MYEVNFDGIVGLTHNYSGLSYGNVASILHGQKPSNPKQAALQGLAKMKYLADRGIKQGVLPPQERPHIPSLRSLGFRGSDSEILAQAFQNAPELLFACSSASCMWAANAATVSPSSDSMDRRVHFTPANLSSKFHRSIEPPTTRATLQAIFSEPKYFEVHPALPSGCYITDEGAANHTRFCAKTGKAGVQLFAYGRRAFQQGGTTRYPARQSLEASQAIVRFHQLKPEQVIYAQQNPKAIDAGVFHNDVISVGHQNIFLYHSAAFVDMDDVIGEIRHKMKDVCGSDMIFIPVMEDRISLQDAVSTYLFNSQLVTLPDLSIRLIAPSECRENDRVRGFIEETVANPSNPIGSVCYFDLHQSMQNGGGPACLRLRVVLSEDELKASNQNVYLTDTLYKQLTAWVERHYRDRLVPNDLADPELLDEGKRALDELTQILKLGALYDFQK